MQSIKITQNYNSAEKIRNNNKQQNFKGSAAGVLTGLRFLDDSPAVGACVVDVASMVMPRTIIEAKNRGTQSGIETFFREILSCAINACVGVIGLGAAALVSKNFNKQYGVKAENIFANGDTIKSMSELWQNSGGSKEFFENFAGNIKGLNGTQWKTISADKKDEIVTGLLSLAEKTKLLENASGTDKKALKAQTKELKNTLLAQITQNTGAKASFKLNPVKEGTKEVSASLSELVDNAVSLSNAFAAKSKEKLPEFVEALKNNKRNSTLLGIGICLALCTSVQPINRWLTKKRTGEDGFVGVENKENDKSKKFKIAKTLLGIGFPLIAASTIGKPADIMSKIQFNSKLPTISQFKLIYGSTIGSRLLAARDSNELREGVIKDSLGFSNWLILGGMVSKLAARGLGGKELINNPVAQDSGKKGIKYAFQWLTKASVKSYDEVLIPTAKELSKDGKLLKFSELVKNAEPAVKSKVMKIAASQVAGYLYSGLVLGIGISKLNIFITKQIQAKKDANKNMNESVNSNGNSSKFDTKYLAELKTKASPIFKEFS